MDKREKLSRADFLTTAQEKNISDTQCTFLINFMECTTVKDLCTHFPQIATSKGFQDIQIVLEQIEKL